jgi:hypothetical protein
MWEPWRTVRNTRALKDFLTTHRKESVRNLLPQNVLDEDESDESDESNNEDRNDDSEPSDDEF